MATLYDTGSSPANGAGTFDSILKEFYIGPVQEQLNQEVMALEMFEKATVDWNGKHCIIPVHTGRNTSVAFRGDGVEMGGANAQDFAHLTVKAKFLYGQFEVTGPAIAAAAKGSTNSFISYVDAEMNMLVEDIRDKANKAVVSGGRVKGFICQRSTGNTWESTDGAIANGGEVFIADVLYDGDFAPFTGCTTVGDLTAVQEPSWIEVDLINTKTGLTLGAANDVFYVCDGSSAGYGESAGKLKIGRGNTGGSGTADNLSLSSVDDPHCVAVVLKDTLTVANTGKVLASTDGAGTSQVSDEITGIFGNIADPSHFGVTRTSATNSALLSTVQTQTTSGSFTTRAALSVSRMQGMFDEILANSGTEPDAIIMSPLQRQKYTALLSENIQQLASTAAGAGHAGFLSLNYNGVQITASRSVPNGMVLFLKTDTWKLTELEPGGFADLDGNVLSRTASFDKYTGYYRWYWNLVCTRPGANAILCGLTL